MAHVQSCHDCFCPSRRNCQRGVNAPGHSSADFHRQGNTSCYAFVPRLQALPDGRARVSWDFMSGAPA